MRGSLVITIFFVFIWYGFFRQYTLQATETMVGSAMYICDDGKSINAFFYDKKSSIYIDSSGIPIPQGKVEIALSDGRSLSLPQTVSPAGVRYALQDESFVFWTDSNKALVSEKNTQKDYVGCIRIAQQLPGTNLSRVYVDSKTGFSLRLPGTDVSDQDGYMANNTYRYQAPSPGKEISGVSFSVPSSMTQGTNLSSDTYISVEWLPGLQNCFASSFFGDKNVVNLNLTENNTTYSVASMTDAGAGNHYEEMVYAISGTNSCVAMRYSIHYTDIENYEPTTVKEFDKAALLAEFDQIRHSLVVAQ